MRSKAIRSQKPAFFRVVLIQLLIFLVLLTIAELILAFVFPVVPDKSVTKHYTQNIDGLKNEIIYDRNRVGLRTNSISTIEKPDSTIRILCIGASTTDQATQSTEDTWCAKLQQQLSLEYEDTELVFESAAYGRGGIRAIDNAVWLSEYLNVLEPDIVVTLLGINDLTLNGGNEYKPREIEQVLHTKTASAAEHCQSLLQLCRRGVSLFRNIRQMYRLKSGGAVEWHSKHLFARREYYRSLPLVEASERRPDPINEFSGAVTGYIELYRLIKSRLWRWGSRYFGMKI